MAAQKYLYVGNSRRSDDVILGGTLLRLARPDATIHPPA